MEAKFDIGEIQTLLQEVVEHLQRGRLADRRQAMLKLARIASLASTMALMLQVGRNN